MDIQSTNAYFPLSGFHRAKTSLSIHGKPELLFLGALGADYSTINVERWPLVKALDQFGALSDVSPLDRQCMTLHGGPANGTLHCTIPSYDLSRAKYSSRYVAFVSRDPIREARSGAQPFQHLSRVEQDLFNRYVLPPPCSHHTSPGSPTPYPCGSQVSIVYFAVNNMNSQRALPLIAIGSYLQTVSQDMNQGDFVTMEALTTRPNVYAASRQGMSFQTVQQALIQGKNPLTTHLVEDVNAEANIITALICHADGKLPSSVCGRPAIKSILTHVR
jgi:hypothetical protein